MAAPLNGGDSKGLCKKVRKVFVTGFLSPLLRLVGVGVRG